MTESNRRTRPDTTLPLYVGVFFGVFIAGFDLDPWWLVLAGFAFGVLYAFLEGFIGAMWDDIR